jgi:hypothetical protein
MFLPFLCSSLPWHFLGFHITAIDGMADFTLTIGSLDESHGISRSASLFGDDSFTVALG